jgi:hypothetical protein
MDLFGLCANNFHDLAREVEADESPDAVDRAFKRVVPSRAAAKAKKKPA